MRIAICLWGLMRALRFTIHTFHANVLKPLVQAGHTYEIFVHSYTFKGDYNSSRNLEGKIFLNFTEWRLLKPNYIYVENQDIFDQQIHYPMYQSKGDPWNNNYDSFKNHMRALNSLHHVTMVVENMCKSRSPNAHLSACYDAILFVRPDVSFLHRLPSYFLTHPSEKVLYLPDFHRSCFGKEYNDRMAMGGYDAALAYGKKLQVALAYSLKHQLHAEKFTYAYLNGLLSDGKDSLVECMFSVNTSHSSLTEPIFPRNMNSTSYRACHTHNPIFTTPTSVNSFKILEIPFRFRRIRSTGEVHIRDYEAITPEEQVALERKGDRFASFKLRTPWYLKFFYTMLEYLTLGMVYIWNHDDNGNVFCTPHQKVNVLQYIKDERKYINTYHSHFPLSPSKAQGNLRIACNYIKRVVIHADEKKEMRSKYIVPVQCRYVNGSSVLHADYHSSHHYYSTQYN